MNAKRRQPLPGRDEGLLREPSREITDVERSPKNREGDEVQPFLPIADDDICGASTRAGPHDLRLGQVDEAAAEG